jgi:O-antigen/teichoic acid export membrane protein
MSLIKKLASETAIYGLSSIVGRVLNFLLVPIHTRIFLEGEYGIISKLYAVAGFMMVVLTYRMETAFFRFGTPEETREKSFSTAMIFMLGATGFFLAVSMFFTHSLAQWLRIPDRADLVVIISLILSLDALAEIPFARLRLEHKAKKFALIKLVNIFMNIALTLFFLLLCPKLANAHPGSIFDKIYDRDFGIGYVFLANLTASAVTIAVFMPQILGLRAGFDRALWRKMIVYAAPLVVVGFAGIADEVLDRILLEELLPYSIEENQAQVGIYSACLKLTVILAFFTQAFRYAAEPFFFAHAQKEGAAVLYGQVGKFFTLAGSIGVLVVLLYLDWFRLLVDRRYWGALDAVPVLLLASLFLGLYYNFSTWYRLTDRTIWGVYISLFGLAITVIFNFWWIPLYGYMGSAWAKLLCYGSMMAAGWYFGQKYYPVQYPLGRMTTYVGLAVGLYLLSKWLKLTLNWQPVGVFILNTMTLFLFLAVAYFLERKSLNLSKSIL